MNRWNSLRFTASFLCSAAFLFGVVPVPAVAHPGHVVELARHDSAVHYLLQPSHLAPLLIAAIFISVVALLAARARASRTLVPARKRPIR